MWGGLESKASMHLGDQEMEAVAWNEHIVRPASSDHFILPRERRRASDNLWGVSMPGSIFCIRDYYTILLHDVKVECFFWDSPYSSDKTCYF